MHMFSFQNEKDEELTTKVYMDQVSFLKITKTKTAILTFLPSVDPSASVLEKQGWFSPTFSAENGGEI